jgi:hypothetical protein
MSNKREKRKAYIKGKIITWMKEAEKDDKNGTEVFQRWKKRMFNFSRKTESDTAGSEQQ